MTRHVKSNSFAGRGDILGDFRIDRNFVPIINLLERK